MTQNHRIFAVHPKTGEILPAIYKEDWFAAGKDAISFGLMNCANYAAEEIEWEFPPEKQPQTKE